MKASSEYISRKKQEEQHLQQVMPLIKQKEQQILEVEKNQKRIRKEIGNFPC